MMREKFKVDLGEFSEMDLKSLRRHLEMLMKTMELELLSTSRWAKICWKSYARSRQFPSIQRADTFSDLIDGSMYYENWKSEDWTGYVFNLGIKDFRDFIDVDVNSWRYLIDSDKKVSPSEKLIPKLGPRFLLRRECWQLPYEEFLFELSIVNFERKSLKDFAKGRDKFKKRLSARPDCSRICEEMGWDSFQLETKSLEFGSKIAMTPLSSNPLIAGAELIMKYGGDIERINQASRRKFDSDKLSLLIVQLSVPKLAERAIENIQTVYTCIDLCKKIGVRNPQDFEVKLPRLYMHSGLQGWLDKDFWNTILV